MTTLYNVRTADNGWMLAKFCNDFNVAGIYTVTAGDPPTCDCPGWPRKRTCKHVRMVSVFALRGAIDTNEFYCYETQQWHLPLAHLGLEDDPSAKRAIEAASKPVETVSSLQPEPALQPPQSKSTGIRRL